MRVGLLGGTFDPIHNGHLAVAEEVHGRLGLSEVIFVPAGQPWFKRGNFVLSARHRLRMVTLAIADRPYARVSTVEIDREGPTYTVDTVEEIGETLDGEIYFILGWDNLPQVPRWRSPGRLAELCRMVAVPRPGYERPDASAVERQVPGLAGRVMLLDRPWVDISASEIRRRVAQGLSICQMVPGAVAEYIGQQRLYLDAA